MADTGTVPAATPASTGAPKKKSSAAGKKPRNKPPHPRTSEMVGGAIKSLKERGGSSLQAIKKYIAANYKVDSEKLAPFIKKYLKTAVASGELVQTKGKGASGSFKLASAGKAEGAASKPAARKAGTAAAKAKKPKTKKPAAGKSASSAKKSAEKKKAPAKAKKSSPSKAKKATKGPAKKPKAPKPKKATTPKRSAGGKKSAPKKK